MKQIVKNKPRKAISLLQNIIMILPAVVMLLSGACSIKQFVPAPGLLSENRYAIIREDSLIIAVRVQDYSGSNSAINNRFFSVYLRVKNNASTRRSIDSSNFSIIAGEKQFDHIPIEFLLANMRQASLLSSYRDPFNVDNNDNFLREEAKQQELYYELIANAFRFGNILPGGVKEGYLFYNRDIYQTDSFGIDVLGKSIGFIKTKR